MYYGVWRSTVRSMWTERPRPLRDGLLAAAAIAVALASILTLANVGTVVPTSKCQEVIVTVEKQGNVLAQCPPETYIEILDNMTVYCRCGERRVPESVQIYRDRSPYPLQNPEPPPVSDDHRGIEL